jgi:hypothetical protein
MHRMSNLNQFKDPNLILDKYPRFCLMRKRKKFKSHKEHLNKKKLPKIFTTNTLCANVYKMYECDKNQMLYCNVKKFKKSQIFENFGPLIKHGPHWIKFTILIFLSESNRYLKGLYKTWNKIISCGMKKKR